jgi:putative hydrolase of the HAD superfamily
MAASMAMQVKAVLLDGMGTLLRLVPPAPALARALGVDEPTAERAFAAEVAYYLEHQLEGSDAAGLADLRTRSAAAMAEAAGVELAPEAAVAALMSSLRFEAYEDAAPALMDLRERGLRLVVVSNWDWSLTDVLGGLGLLPLLDAVITSAEAGAQKPGAAIFQAGLAAAGCSAAEAVHVGDSAGNDVEGARAAGVRPLLLAREGGGDLTSLAELPALLS